MPHDLLGSLAKQRAVFGCWHVIVDPTMSEALRDVALDFLVFDQQHVAVTIESLQRALIALRPTPKACLVRVLDNDAAGIGQVLDAGADGVIVPMVNTAEDATRAVAAARYRPAGIRSWGPRRAVLRFPTLDAFIAEADGSVVLVQVETAEAVANLDAILAVPGIDGVMIGPGDLAISLGYLADQENPGVRDVVNTVLAACLARGVPFGIFTDSVADCEYWVSRGGLILCCGADIAFATDGMTRLAADLDEVRARHGERPGT